MTGSFPERLERLANLSAHRLGRCEQHRRIETSLKPSGRTDATPRVGQVYGPIEANAVASACSDALQPGPAALGEHDDGDARLARAALESGEHSLDVFERELPVCRSRKAPAP